jgi:succinyl-diaminopimelate desuccinylase
MSPDHWHGGADQAQIVASAREDHESVLALTRALVRIPSRAGIDPYDPIIDLLSRWMREHDLPADVVRDGTGAAVGLTAEVHGAHPAPRWVLDACLDSAPFGDENAWTHPPTSGITDNGWLWGRGSSDSKVAVAIFCHLAARLAGWPPAPISCMGAWCCCSTWTSTPVVSAVRSSTSKAKVRRATWPG